MTDPTPDQPEATSEASQSSDYQDYSADFRSDVNLSEEQRKAVSAPAEQPPAKRRPGPAKKPASQRKRSVGYRLAPDVVDGIKALAAERGCSQADLVETWYRQASGDTPVETPVVPAEGVPLRDDSRAMLEEMASHQGMTVPDLLHALIQREKRRFDKHG